MPARTSASRARGKKITRPKRKTASRKRKAVTRTGSGPRKKVKERVIPLEMIPEVGSEVITIDRVKYLQTNEAMFTFYKRTKGEQSPFFLALKEKKRILGARCPKCRLVRVPPFQLYCPDCDFEALELQEMPDTGVMNSTPPITYFAHSLFAHQVPFGRGRVMLEGADTALPMHVYTTRGILTPRVFGKGTPVKVIFRKERLGSPTDIFAVPLEEVPSRLRNKKGVEEHELDWTQAQEPPLPPPTPESRRDLQKVLTALQGISRAIAKSPRARKDLAGWKRRIQVKTGGGPFLLVIENQGLKIKAGSAKADFVMVCPDPALFSDWISFRDSLTNAIIAEKLWISRNAEFTTVFKLDRIPRSLKRQ